MGGSPMRVCRTEKWYCASHRGRNNCVLPDPSCPIQMPSQSDFYRVAKNRNRENPEIFTSRASRQSRCNCPFGFKLLRRVQLTPRGTELFSMDENFGSQI